MAEESKEIVVKIDKQTYSVIEEFSEHTTQDKDEIINYFLDRSLEEFVTNYKNLKQGYVDMGNINLEISDAFTVSENEAENGLLNHIQDKC